MAAPGEVYSGDLFMGSVPYAIRLLEYDSDMKLLFHLDALLCAGDNPATAPFIGLIINNPLSPNYKFHAAARRFNFTVEIDGVNYIALNDGGLNTLGSCNVGTLSAIANVGVIIPITYRNAYYVASSDIRVMYKKNGDTLWTEYSVRGATPEKELVTFSATLTSLSGSLAPNDLVYVKVKNINPEGTFTSDQVSLTLPFAPLVMAYSGAYASTANTNYGTDTDKAIRYFSTYDVNIGTAIYDNSTGYITLPAGYYACPNFWIKVEMNSDPSPKSVVTAMGFIGSWPSGDPLAGATYGTHSFIYFETTDRWNVACAYLSGSAGTTIPLYQSVANNLYYTDTGLTTLTGNGIYYTSTTEFIIIEAGQLVGSGNCVDGPFGIE